MGAGISRSSWKSARHVGQHSHRRDQRVDAQVRVVPGPHRLASLIGDALAVLGGLPVLGRERADRVHVHQAVGDMSGHPRDRFLALVDEPQQFVHADHVQALDSAAAEGVQAVNADPPHDLGE